MSEDHYKPSEYEEHVGGKVAVVTTRWNWEIVEGLLDGYKSVMEAFDDIFFVLIF